MTREHLTNRRDGGSNTLDNLVLACKLCNGNRNRAEQRHDLNRSERRCVRRFIIGLAYLLAGMMPPPWAFHRLASWTDNP